METVTATVRTSLVQAIPVTFITPAEAEVLRVMHQSGAQGEVLSDITPSNPEAPEAKAALKRTSVQERDRLRWKYNCKDRKTGAHIVDSLWPGANPKLPTTFAEIGIEVGAPTQSPVTEPEPAAEPAATEEPEPVVEVKPKKSKKTLP